MLMSWIFTCMAGISLIAALLLGNGAALAASIPAGAQAGITLAISMAGTLCLWTGISALMEHLGITQRLARLFAPVLHRIFPSARSDPTLSGALSANVCANLLGLGNAATPLGIQAAQCLAKKGAPGRANDQLCRLIVLNTASIQLIPTTVAAVRSALGSARPFSILPAVWITSLCSAGLGLVSAMLLGRVWKK
ncbi:MAG: spore maturation protein A [Ruminococcaceae bacterium]|nr:spore maturation protein A [Oscillospiraceae bacterium]